MVTFLLFCSLWGLLVRRPPLVFVYGRRPHETQRENLRSLITSSFSENKKFNQASRRHNKNTKEILKHELDKNKGEIKHKKKKKKKKKMMMVMTMMTMMMIMSQSSIPTHCLN